MALVTTDCTREVLWLIPSAIWCALRLCDMFGELSYDLCDSKPTAMCMKCVRAIQLSTRLLCCVLEVIMRSYVCFICEI